MLSLNEPDFNYVTRINLEIISVNAVNDECKHYCAQK